MAEVESDTSEENCYIAWVNDRKDYKVIETMMKEKFQTQEEPLIKHCKNEKELKEFTCYLIYDLWFQPKLENLVFNSGFEADKYAPDISSKVLNLVFGCQEEIKSFKKNELCRDEQCVGVLCSIIKEKFESMVCDGHFIVMGGSLTYEGKSRAGQPFWMMPTQFFEVLDRFIYFCTGSAEKIFEIRKSIRDNKIDWIELYGVRKVARVNLTPLIDWISNEQLRLIDLKRLTDEQLQSREESYWYLKNKYSKIDNVQVTFSYI